MQQSVFIPTRWWDKASLAFKSSETTGYTITVTDVAGKILFSKKGSFIKGSNKIDIAVDQFKAGTYFIHISDEHGSYRTSFVKQ